MPVFEQKGNSVLLWRDRVRMRDVVDFETVDTDLKTDGRALVLAHRAGHDDSRLLGQLLAELEDLG